ncbi:VOC family protein [Maricaulis sp. D1M11]|uniref:VOC family protein n=1 Tax=Maricaulis sp. D1M11 TaxID=3076117 RepID=UPI0039B45CAF
MKLNQITIPVSDMARSRAFYVALGFHRIVDETHYCRFLAPEGDTTLSLSLTDQPITPGAVLYLETQDVDAEVERLVSAGLTLLDPPTDQRWLWREALFADPDGHKIKIFNGGTARLDPPWKVTD